MAATAAASSAGETPSAARACSARRTASVTAVAASRSASWEAGSAETNIAAGYEMRGALPLRIVSVRVVPDALTAILVPAGKRLPTMTGSRYLAHHGAELALRAG